MFSLLGPPVRPVIAMSGQSVIWPRTGWELVFGPALSAGLADCPLCTAGLHPSISAACRLQGAKNDGASTDVLGHTTARVRRVHSKSMWDWSLWQNTLTSFWPSPSSPRQSVTSILKQFLGLDNRGGREDPMDWQHCFSEAPQTAWGVAAVSPLSEFLLCISLTFHMGCPSQQSLALCACDGPRQ